MASEFGGACCAAVLLMSMTGVEFFPKLPGDAFLI